MIAQQLQGQIELEALEGSLGGAGSGVDDPHEPGKIIANGDLSEASSRQDTTMVSVD